MASAPAPIGHNNPPAPTPYEAIKAHVDDLEAEALNHLDGKPIETEAQAAAVSKLLSDARDARKAAEEQRKIEAKPWDDGKAAVQALWKPLADEKTSRPAMIAETAKKALAVWLQRQDDEQRAAAQALQEEANRQAEAAAQAAQQTRPDDLAGQTTARVLQEQAAATRKAAEKADKARPQAKGGERAVGLRSRWTAILADPCAALKYYREKQPAELKAWLTEQAQRDVNAGARATPGFEIKEEKVAV